jgi:hypothetical protein
MAQPTAAQVAQYQFHRRLCRVGIPGLGPIGQSTLEHRVLQGTISAPSGTGNVLYTGPGPSTTDLVSTTTKVWMISEPLVQRGGGAMGSQTEIGAQSVPMMRAQIPAIDDFGNAVAIAHDDLVIDPSGIKYKVENPVQTPDVGLWSFNLVRQR